MQRLTIQDAFALALRHYQAGQLREAEQIYRQILAQSPGVPEVHNELGVVLHQSGKVDQAMIAYRRAIALRPAYPEAHNHLAIALLEKGQVDPAIAACRKAIALSPNYAEAHSNLGNSLKDKGESDQAIAAHRRAIALNPNLPQAFSNLGVALLDANQFAEAIAAYRQAVALRPDYAEAHFNLANALLTVGELKEGWEEFEWRTKCEQIRVPRKFSQPLWDGHSLKGRTLLLHADGGFGDTIQLSRFLPRRAQRSGKIILECQGELQRLLGNMAHEYQIVAAGQPLPAFDVHLPLLSLPRLIGTTLQNIPITIPYLQADPKDIQTWHGRLADRSKSVNVGLAWGGSPAQRNDRNRSMSLAQLAPLGANSQACFFSLQKGEPTSQAKTPPAGMTLVDWSDDLKDFADTAALIANLDLVITVDTAVAHLAGALGKPVWIMLPFLAPWQWLLDRPDSPWYPTARLFRQTAAGDWSGVVSAVSEALTHVVHDKSGG